MKNCLDVSADLTVVSIHMFYIYIYIYIYKINPTFSKLYQEHFPVFFLTSQQSVYQGSNKTEEELICVFSWWLIKTYYQHNCHYILRGMLFL